MDALSKNGEGEIFGVLSNNLYVPTPQLVKGKHCLAMYVDDNSKL